MGIGHRVYKHGDPRARILRKMSQELTARAHAAAVLRDVGQHRRHHAGEKRPHANVDFYSATVYYCMGIPIDLYTPIFAVSRVSGWIAIFSSNT